MTVSPYLRHQYKCECGDRTCRRRVPLRIMDFDRVARAGGRVLHPACEARQRQRQLQRKVARIRGAAA